MVDLNSNLLPTTPHLNVPNYLKSLHALTRRRDVLARFYNSQAYYQSCANKLSEGERRRKMIEKLTSPFTWKQFIFELLMIGETSLPLSPLQLPYLAFLLAPLVMMILVTELLYSYAENIDQRPDRFLEQNLDADNIVHFSVESLI